MGRWTLESMDVDRRARSVRRTGRQQGDTQAGRDQFADTARAECLEPDPRGEALRGRGLAQDRMQTAPCRQADERFVADGSQRAQRARSA